MAKTDKKEKTDAIKVKPKSLFDPTQTKDKQILNEAQKYYKGKLGDTKKLKGGKVIKRVEKQNEFEKEKAVLAAKSNWLLPEETGYLEAEGMEKTYKFTQNKLNPLFDINTSNKRIELKLDQFGPYKLDFTRNGKYMLIGGRKGHVASFDWNNGRLLSELQLKETVRDVTWLHNESMFAVAQKQYVYIYDKSGMEIHCLKKQNEVYALDYLPYHFLLTSIGRQGILRYQDTSTGILIGEYRTGMGVCQVMKQNPQNAIMHLGHNNGTVSLWSPNSKDPLVKMLCHKGNVLDLAVDLSGRHMVTSGMDGLLKVWDMRNYKEMHSYYTPRPASSVDISQKGMLAASFNSTVNIWKDIRKEQTDGSYMSHLSPANQIHQVKFVPFEDILSFGGDKGINNVIIPGSGEPNFDSLEANPFETKKQRQESEVHSLLDKIQPDTIMLDSNILGGVYNQESDDEDLNIPNIRKDVEIRDKKRGKGSSKSRFYRKKDKGVQQVQKVRMAQTLKNLRKKDYLSKNNQNPVVSSQKGKVPSALARFAKSK